VNKGRYKHEIPLDLYGPIPPQPKAPVYEPVKRQPYDSLYLKLKSQRDHWNPES
jgi:hypothetical protein